LGDVSFLDMTALRVCLVYFQLQGIVTSTKERSQKN